MESDPRAALDRVCATGEPIVNVSHVPTHEQLDALMVLMHRRAANNSPSNVLIVPEPLDLPSGYILVSFARDGFTCGISREGVISS